VKGGVCLKISVAMAVFNGEEYIGEQISSILAQLNKDDELVISDDNSTDNTKAIILDFCETNSQIKFLKGPCNGVIQNFENAIYACSGDIIFLCDQDDVWLLNKKETVLEALCKSEADLVLHDAFVTDSKLNIIQSSFFEMRGSKAGFLHNYLKNSYMGCCMAFKSDFRKVFLPFPKNIPMHDQWIGLMAEYFGSVHFIKVPLIKYRRHSGNATDIKHSSWFKMIKGRVVLAFKLINAIIKVNN
jgi:glycosyltransferase involved in cell wall biosynthesis